MSWELVPESQGLNDPGAGNARQLRSPRWVLTLVGVLISALGLALLIWPFFAASRILAILIGAALIGNGIAALVGLRARGVAAPAGILLLIIGLLAIAFPNFTVVVLVSFVALVMLSIGVLWLLIAIPMRNSVGPMFIIPPALLVVLGIAAFIWPEVALVLAAVAAGIVTLFIGGSLVWASFALRRKAR